MRNKTLSVILALLALIGAAALMLFVVVPAIKENRTQAPTETASAVTQPQTQAETRQPTTAPTQPITTEPVTTQPVTTEAVTTEPPETEPPTEPLPEPTPTDVETGPGDVSTAAYKSGTVFISEGCGYGAYYFGKTNSTRYCEAVSSVARAVEGKATVYCLIAPISTGIMLSDAVRSDLGFSDENAAMAWMYGHMDPLVKPVPIYGALKLHNDENIYFHTDHHWTALGAWYAYREFCAQKGIRPHEPEEFETYVYSDYLGSFVNYSDGNAELKNNPDTLVAYIPKGTNRMTMYIPEGSGYGKYEWPIVKDMSSGNRGSYYLGFVSGDRPWSYAHNETITDGSAVLVVKDSYGNAFIPWLIDHYEHIYWIDYRSYAEWSVWAGVENSSISNFVERNDIQDVILLNQIGSTGSGTNLKDMEKIFK